jgi:hypothetical protein
MARMQQMNAGIITARDLRGARNCILGELRCRADGIEHLGGGETGAQGAGFLRNPAGHAGQNASLLVSHVALGELQAIVEIDDLVGF